MKMKFSLLLLVFSLFWFGCGKDNPVSGCDNCEDNDVIEAAYDPKPFELDIPDWLPRPALSEDNPLTEAGVTLGRQLFYDPILSSDGTM